MEEIGRGASARIYSGLCLNTLKLVAIKMFTSVDNDLSLCEHEYRVLESLLNHTNCIQLIDSNIPKGILVLEKGECTLSTLMTPDRIGNFYFFQLGINDVNLY